jgi:hypothetical protein
MDISTKAMLLRPELAIYAGRRIELSLSALSTTIEENDEFLQMVENLKRRKYRLHQTASQVQNIY